LIEAEAAVHDAEAGAIDAAEAPPDATDEPTPDATAEVDAKEETVDAPAEDEGGDD
jgi:hypothetical protein